MATRTKKVATKSKTAAKASQTASQAGQKISPALAAAYETAQGLFKAGVMDKTTMKEFDAAGVARLSAYGGSPMLLAPMLMG